MAAAAYGLTQVFAARAAYVHVGAMIGTMMAANVFFVIIPNQRKMVDAMLAGEARRDLLAAVPREVEPLRVGLPLALSLWQVFEHEVGQRVEHAPLADVLRAEQRRVLAHLISTPSRDDLEAFMATHATRWQATMILLCDALSVAPALLTSPRIDSSPPIFS